MPLSRWSVPLVLVWLMAAGAQEGAELEVLLPQGAGSGEVRLTGRAGLGDPVVSFLDGRADQAGRAVAMEGTWRRVGEAVEWSGPFQARLTVRQAAELPVVDLRLTARGAPVWLRVVVRLPFAFDEWRCFDGRGDRPSRAGRITQRRVLGTFPAVAAFDDRGGWGLGLDPGCWVSRFELGTLAPDGRHGQLTVAVPIVVEPGHPETLSVALSRFETGPFGYLPMIEQWHTAFPTRFRPADGIDRRLLAACAAGAADEEPVEGLHPNGFDAAAICRGAGAGWEWKYAKFKMGGDLLGRPEAWSRYVPEKAAAVYRGGLEQFQAWRQRNFARTEGLGVANAFYLINWVDEALAPDFADSLIAAEDAYDHRGVKIKSWIHTYTTDERAYPWGNSLGARLREDVAAIVKQLPVSAVAHDVAVGGSRYRPRSYQPGQSYDEQGAYVDEGLGIAQLMRYAHSLKTTAARRCGTTANLYAGSHYAIVTETDHAIFEGTAYQGLLSPADALRDRLLLGAKPRSWFVHLYQDDIGNLVDSAERTPEALREILRARWDTVILWSLRFGWLPCPDLAYGYAPMRRALPVIADCVQAGWKPVSAMSTAEPLWLARYGSGLETRLVVMNPHDRRAVRAEVRVHSRFVGSGGTLYANGDGSPTTNRLEGQDVLLEVDLPPRSWRLFVAVGRHHGGTVPITVRTSPRVAAMGQEVGVVRTHLPTTPGFYFGAATAASRAFYERAGVVLEPLGESEGPGL